MEPHAQSSGGFRIGRQLRHASGEKCDGICLKRASTLVKLSILVGASHSRLIRRDNHLDFPTFTTPFDTLVAVLVEILKVISKFRIFVMYLVVCELFCQLCQSVFMELVHVCFEVPKLSKDFTTAILVISFSAVGL